MNYKKAYSEIIAEIMKDGSRVFFDEMGDTGYIAVVPTGYYAFVFPKYKFLLNTECMTITTNITKICQRENCADALAWTGVVKQNKKIMVVELKNAAGDIVLLNEKIVKLFGKTSDLTFRSECNLKPVYVYEKGNFIGIIMPIKPEKEVNHENN